MRTLLGWLFVALGATAMTFAVAGCVWVHLNVYSGQFDLRPVWFAGGLVVALGGAMVGAGLFVLRKP